MDYLPITVIARWAKRETSGIRKACIKGDVKAYKLGGTWLIDKDDARRKWGKQTKDKVNYER